MVQVRAGEASPDDPLFKLASRRYQCLLHSMIEQRPYGMTDAEGNTTSLEEAIADPYEPEREIERQDTIEQVHWALDCLSPLEAYVIRQRFGIIDHSTCDDSADCMNRNTRRSASLSFRKLSRVLGISPDYARKVEQRALGKLQERLGPRLAPDGVLEG
jgi:DNA-directed RNA polymerase sigma subunit (sigma70/sigma32)